MRVMRHTERKDRGSWGDDCRELAIGAGMLAFLIGLAVIFVASGPH